MAKSKRKAEERAGEGQPFPLTWTVPGYPPHQERSRVDACVFSRHCPSNGIISGPRCSHWITDLWIIPPELPQETHTVKCLVGVGGGRGVRSCGRIRKNLGHPRWWPPAHQPRTPQTYACTYSLPVFLQTLCTFDIRERQGVINTQLCLLTIGSPI